MRNKNKVISIRVYDWQEQLLKEKVSEAKTTMTDYILRCALNKKIIIVDNKDLIIQLKRIGNNLNQVTTLANMGRINFVNLSETCLELSKIYEEVGRLNKKWQ